MGYIKADDILPKELLKQIQKFVDGAYIYIPRSKLKRKHWGSNTKTKELLSVRNQSIYIDYQQGKTVKQLSQKYFLVEESIRRILRSQKLNHV